MRLLFGTRAPVIALDERASELSDPVIRIPRDSDIQQLPKLNRISDSDTWTVTLQAG